MAVSRRRFALAGATGVALAACGSVLRSASAASDDLPNGSDAYAPWRTWSEAETGPRHWVHAAILAANAHDTQPWQFCATPERIAVYADEGRNLGAMDPFRREMHISLGCALENLAIAAQAQGFDAQVAVTPGSVVADPAPKGARLAATVSLQKGGSEAAPLLTAIPRRHTNRGPYDPARPVDTKTLDQLRALATGADDVRLILLTDAGAHAAFADATVAATQAIIADATMIADSDAWFRGTDAEIEKHRDGPTIYAAGLSPFRQFMAGIMPAPSAEQSHDYWLNLTRETQLATAPVFGLIAVRDLYDRSQAITAGRLWQHLHLQGTLLGLGMQPLNQLPERVDRERQLGKPAETEKVLAGLTGDPVWRPTFAFRLGWPVRPAPASPRRTLDSVMLPEGCPA